MGPCDACHGSPQARVARAAGTEVRWRGARRGARLDRARSAVGAGGWSAGRRAVGARIVVHARKGAMRFVPTLVEHYLKKQSLERESTSQIRVPVLRTGIAKVKQLHSNRIVQM